ncbi:MAG: LPXTG cell wall anchor domain-containing protein [Firmicutes bacterium]|uniref:LPXTG cell wall anchor domain-containing protein n=1 Tax=Candidatus Gallilactobacillus intestinavium TaxID=2840838 RepID=A0A9D9E565_9LACO|nr:LPXTG cell wall anchor domain-containing protein [Candidatus Gallilactobacillus intestinavium]
MSKKINTNKILLTSVATLASLTLAGVTSHAATNSSSSHTSTVLAAPANGSSNTASSTTSTTSSDSSSSSSSSSNSSSSSSNSSSSSSDSSSSSSNSSSSSSNSSSSSSNSSSSSSDTTGTDDNTGNGNNSNPSQPNTGDNTTPTTPSNPEQGNTNNPDNNPAGPTYKEFPDDTLNYLSDVQADLVKLINQLRAANGLQPLTEQEALDKIATEAADLGVKSQTDNGEATPSDNDIDSALQYIRNNGYNGIAFVNEDNANQHLTAAQWAQQLFAQLLQTKYLQYLLSPSAKNFGLMFSALANNDNYPYWAIAIDGQPTNLPSTINLPNGQKLVNVNGHWVLENGSKATNNALIAHASNFVKGAKTDKMGLLPHTGESNNSFLAVLGEIMASVLGFLGLAGATRKKNN